ncbi:MAG: aspartate dehydrogenase [Candidatus Asgardarchaeia archaeon]
MLRIGIVGCGALGGEIVRAYKDGLLEGFDIVALLDIEREKAESLARMMGKENVVVGSIDELLEKDVDLVIEAASPHALKEISEKVLKYGKILIAMSVGAFLDERFYKKIIKILDESDGRVIIPSGAIGGVDILKAASLTEADAKLTTIKSIDAFKRAKNLEKLGINLNEIRERTLIFKGKASEAINYFPTMLNVSGTISLAIGKDIDVEVYADPKIDHTIHEIEMVSEATKAKITIINKHHPKNPKTSYIAVLSVIGKLKEFSEKFSIGT